jgi:hypothetical protein
MEKSYMYVTLFIRVSIVYIQCLNNMPYTVETIMGLSPYYIVVFVSWMQRNIDPIPDNLLNTEKKSVMYLFVWISE